MNKCNDPVRKKLEQLLGKKHHITSKQMQYYKRIGYLDKNGKLIGTNTPIEKDRNDKTDSGVTIGQAVVMKVS